MRVARTRPGAAAVLLLAVALCLAACLNSADDGPSAECTGAACTDGDARSDAPEPAFDAPSGPDDGAADAGAISDADAGRDALVADFGTPQIACTFTKSAPYEQSVWDVAVSATGRIGFVGGVKGVTDGGTPPVDLGDGTLLAPKLGQDYGGFVAELDTSCHLLWARSVPYAVKTAFDSAGNIWVGSIENATPQSPAWLTKVGPTGVVLFQTSFSPIVSIQALAVDAMDNVVIAGEYGNSPSIGGAPLPPPNNLGAFVAKFDKNGVHQWSKGFAGTMSCDRRIDSATVDPSGDIVVAGLFGGNANGCDFSLGGAPLSATTAIYPFNSGFIGRLSTVDGSHLWSRAWQGTDVGSACSTPTRSLFLAGTAWTTVDFGSGPTGPAAAGQRIWYAANLASDGGSNWGRAVSVSPPAPNTVTGLMTCGSPLGENALLTGNANYAHPFIQLTYADGGLGWTGKPLVVGTAVYPGATAVGMTRDIAWGVMTDANSGDIVVVRYVR